MRPIKTRNPPEKIHKAQPYQLVPAYAPNVTSSIAKWPVSPSDRKDTFPSGEIVRCVTEPFIVQSRSQPSGGNCKARSARKRITFAWHTKTSYSSEGASTGG